MTTGGLVVLPFVVPLAGAALAMAFHRQPRIQRRLGLTALTLQLAAAVALLARLLAEDAPLVAQAGEWPAPFGITVVADMFAALMVTVSATVLLAVLVYAIGHPGTQDLQRYFHPVYLILAAGVAFAFLTGDLFNLFVAFEVMLSSSYVLILLGGEEQQVRAGMTYVVISLLASLLFVTAVGLVYAATGTVNLADLAGRISAVPPGLRSALGLLLLVVFGIKAALFPLFFWLPDAYPTAPAPVTAVFAGLLTKVGIYAIARTQLLVFADLDGPSPLLLTVAGATMLVGVLGAIVQEDIKRILSFHIVSQVGYMVMGLGLLTLAGVAAMVFYIIHHILVKTSLFLVGGIVEHIGGSSSLRDLGGLVRSRPATSFLFALPALSLAGLPPFSGFPAKLGLVDAGFAVQQPLIVAVSLLVSLLTLFSMAKIWTGTFWGREPEESAREHPPGRTWRMHVATSAVVALTVAVALGAGPLWDLSQTAADQLLSDTYVEAVLR